VKKKTDILLVSWVSEHDPTKGNDRTCFCLLLGIDERQESSTTITLVPQI
jgi:hypothetical protein